MKKFQLVSVNILSLVAVSLFSQSVYSGKHERDEEPVPYQAKKQKIQGWETEVNDNEVIVTNPQENTFTYQISKPIDTCLSKKVDLILDPQNESAYLIIKYKPFLRSEDPLLEYVWFNSNTGIYSVSYDKPNSDENLYDSVTFVPKFNSSHKPKDWTFNENLAPLNFLKNAEGKRLIDPKEREFHIIKAENKVLNKVIYSLHVISPEGSHCINVSEYLKRDHGIEVESVDTCARFLNEEKGLSLLINVTDKLTGETSLFGIDVKNILNKTQEIPFLRADKYAYSLLLITEKNVAGWEIKGQQMLDNTGNVMVTDSGERFYYRFTQRKLKGNALGDCVYWLHVVDESGQDHHINLSYYLDRDYNQKAPREIKDFHLSGNGKYVWFLIDDYCYLIEMKDIKNKNYKPVYAPIMRIEAYDKSSMYYADFISLDINNCISKDLLESESNSESDDENDSDSESDDEEIYELDNEGKDLLRKYASKIPMFLCIDKQGDCKINLFIRDQLHCQAKFTKKYSISNFEQKINNGTNLFKILNNDKKVFILEEGSNFPRVYDKPVKEIEQECFDPNLLPPEKFPFSNTYLLFNREAEYLLRSFIAENIVDLSKKKIALLKCVYSEDLLKKLESLLNDVYGKKMDGDYKKVFNEENDEQMLINATNYYMQIVDDLIDQKLKLKDYYCIYDNISIYFFMQWIKIKKNNNLYTKEFQEVLDQRNWTPFSNRAEGTKAFEKLVKAMHFNDICIDIKNNEFFINENQSDNQE